MRLLSRLRTKGKSKANLAPANASEPSSTALSLRPSLADEASACVGDDPETCDPPASSAGNVDQQQRQAPQLKAESCQSLWDQAYENLRNEKRDLVIAFEKVLMSESEIELTSSLGDGDSSQREKQMSALVSKKLAIMNERQWRIRVCGRSVKTREQVDRVVKVVLVAKDLISSVASLDPIHAGLPWAGVCMLLPLVVNDTKQRTAAIDGLEYISQLVRRYAEIEDVYLQGEEIGLRDDLVAAITKLYSQVLEYEARAACQFNRNTALQIARNIIEADSWERILVNVKASEMACDKLKEIIDGKDQRVRTKRLENMLDKQARKVEELLQVSRTQDEELLAEIKAMRKDQKASFQIENERNCHKSLRTTAYENTMEKNPDRVPGTCEWFLHHLRYCMWLDEIGSNLLWVTADPGCGKSVLSKFLINDYKSWMWKDTSICYFFFKDDSEENKSATNALCAILHQLFIQNPALLKHAMTEFHSNGTKLPHLCAR